jgi:hypothetical protein
MATCEAPSKIFAERGGKLLNTPGLSTIYHPVGFWRGHFTQVRSVCQDISLAEVLPFSNLASLYNFDFVEKLGFTRWILLSLRSHAYAVTLFPPLAGQVNQKKDKGQRTKEKGKKNKKCESIIL